MSEQEAQTTPDAPKTPEKAKKRYDILVLSQNRGFRAGEQILKSLLNYLQATNIVRVYDEAVAKEWVEVYSKAGPTAHDAFVKGVYSSEEATFLEATVRGGVRPTEVELDNGEKETCYFWIEFRGALFPELMGKIRTKLKDVLMTRLDFYTREHVALPPHLTVPDDEIPEAKPRARRDNASPRVGTAVEEF